MSIEVPQKRKVLHIINGFGAGGVEIWLLAAVNYLKIHPELNLQFDFLITGGTQGLFDSEIKNSGSEIFYNGYSISRPFKFRRGFRKILKKNKYIAVHNHQDFVAGWHYLFGGKYLPAMRIVHLHNTLNFVNNYITNPARWLSYKVGRALMARYSTKITGTSNAVLDQYGYNRWPFSAKKVSPTYCGFDTARFRYNELAKRNLCNELSWDPFGRIALFVGRISLEDSKAINEKNPQFALKIAKELIANNGEWHFLFVGYKGELGARMEQELVKEGLCNRIRFLGIRKDIPELMSASDVFIFPSLAEGLGMVGVEAQCSGLKVIMSENVPKESIICPDIVTVQSIEDKASVWVEAILRFSSPQHDREKYAEEISKSPFSIENSISRLISLYES